MSYGCAEDHDKISKHYLKVRSDQYNSDDLLKLVLKMAANQLIGTKMVAEAHTLNGAAIRQSMRRSLQRRGANYDY